MNYRLGKSDTNIVMIVFVLYAHRAYVNADFMYEDKSEYYIRDKLSDNQVVLQQSDGFRITW